MEGQVLAASIDDVAASKRPFPTDTSQEMYNFLLLYNYFIVFLCVCKVKAVGQRERSFPLVSSWKNV